MGARGRASAVLPADRSERSVGDASGSSAEAQVPSPDDSPASGRDAGGLWSQHAERHTGHLRPTKRKLVDVFVSKDQLGRALEFLNTLFKTLESRGQRVDLPSARGHIRRPALDVREAAKPEYHWFRDWSPDRPTVTYIGSVAFGLTLFELTEEVAARHLNGKYVRLSDLPPRRGGYPNSSWSTTHEFATGRLALRASSPYPRAPWEQQWRESKPGSLPGKVSEIVRTLEQEAPVLAQRVAEGERQAELERQRWEEQQRQWEAEERERRRQERIKKSREQLLAAIASFRYAQGFDSFFADVECRVAELDGPERERMLHKVRRARKLLGGVNALERFAQCVPPEEAESQAVEEE